MHKTHKLSFKENPNSYPNFRSEVACTCGFAGKVARPELAVSQGKSHLLAAGVAINTPMEQYVAGLPLDTAQQKVVHDELVADRQRMINANTPGGSGVKPVLTRTPKLIGVSGKNPVKPGQPVAQTSTPKSGAKRA